MIKILYNVGYYYDDIETELDFINLEALFDEDITTDEMIEEHVEKDEEEFSDKDFEYTIELEEPIEENEPKITPRKRVEKNVLEDFDDLFLDD